MKLTITKTHFDKALALPWDTTTCVVAQAINDTFRVKVDLVAGSTASAKLPDGLTKIYRYSLSAIMCQFDKIAGNNSRKFTTIEDCRRVRAMLPCTIEVEVI